MTANLVRRPPGSWPSERPIERSLSVMFTPDSFVVRFPLALGPSLQAGGNKFNRESPGGCPGPSLTCVIGVRSDGSDARNAHVVRQDRQHPIAGGGIRREGVGITAHRTDPRAG